MKDEFVIVQEDGKFYVGHQRWPTTRGKVAIGTVWTEKFSDAMVGQRDKMLIRFRHTTGTKLVPVGWLRFV